ncbi:helix-turn-helix transcriptional regulator [Epilithonimonas tenax]|uniref:helix-turn-helix transcriptional regulator n=1 Tax=Epilithonimonas tenax TaxID=191577 RepID=UPI000481D732|nr:helix-turn-helix domain-containing protein [Epilithonimonas tenax]
MKYKSRHYLVNECHKLKNRIIKLEKVLVENKEILTVKEVEEKYGISRSTIDRYRKKGLKTNQPTKNGKVYINVSELQKFLKK